MNMRDIPLLLDDMLDSVLAIGEYTHGLAEAAFRSNRMVQDAVIRRFEVLGEAANLIPDQYRQQHPEIPWGYMAGMRNRLIHGYFLVDIDILWRTVQIDIPPLETPLRLLRQQYP
jgi:uncharacterized protein with HEPN domain